MTYSCSGILFRNYKKQTTDSHNNMNIFLKCSVKEFKAKDYIHSDAIYMTAE